MHSVSCCCSKASVLLLVRRLLVCMITYFYKCYCSVLESGFMHPLDSLIISQLPNKFPGILHFTIPFNRNKKDINKRTQSQLIRLIRVVFSNGAVVN